jgi:Asp-tRNA(Asn)/Glu-tRNA(Gln) amidotransferase C subunit
MSATVSVVNNDVPTDPVALAKKRKAQKATAIASAAKVARAEQLRAAKMALLRPRPSRKEATCRSASKILGLIEDALETTPLSVEGDTHHACLRRRHHRTRRSPRQHGLQRANGRQPVTGRDGTEGMRR